MLTIAQLEQNKTKFQETNQKYNIMSKELEEFLGDDLFRAPAASSLNMVGCYPGGLLHYMIRACKYSIKVNDIMPEPLKQPVERIVRAVFLSQIGKVGMFKINVGPSSTNKMYGFNDDIVRMRVGERSVYYAMKHGTQLTEEEYQAILNLDKDDEDKMAKYFSSSLTSIIKMGFEIAYMEEKNGKK